MKGAEVSNHHHAHSGHQPNYSSDHWEHSIWDLSPEQPDGVVTGRVAGDEVVTAGVENAVASREERDEEGESEEEEEDAAEEGREYGD